jgi:transposase-like protein
MFLYRGLLFSHKAVCEWEAKLTPILSDELSKCRRGKSGAGRGSWHLDKPYLKVCGCWWYLYRAMDRIGDLVDTMLSGHRDMAMAQFLSFGQVCHLHHPDRVTMDGHGSYPRAIRVTLGRWVAHRNSAYKNISWSRTTVASKAGAIYTGLQKLRLSR